MGIIGVQSILTGKKAAVLNSRQSKTPCGSDQWIVRSEDAVKHLINSGYTIVTSVGMNTWEYIIYLVGRFDGYQIIINPDNDDMLADSDLFNNLIEQYQLDPARTLLITLDNKINRGKPKANWVKRDDYIIENADLLVPVSIKPGGNLEDKTLNSGKEVIDDYPIGYE